MANFHRDTLPGRKTETAFSMAIQTSLINICMSARDIDAPPLGYYLLTDRSSWMGTGIYIGKTV